MASTKTINVDADVQAALTAHPAVKNKFDKLSNSHQNEYLQWIGEAKKPETRAKRIEKMIEMIVSK